MSMRLAFICKKGREAVKGRWKEWAEGKSILEQMRVLTLIALECSVPLTLGTCRLLEATGPEFAFSRTPCFLTVLAQILLWGCKLHNIV